MTYGGGDVFRGPDNAGAPAVFGTEQLSPMEADEELPERAFLPSQRVTDPSQPVTLELRVLTDGNTAMLAYSSLESLVHGCGKGQPWIAVHGGSVEDLRQRSEADLVLWDAAVPVEQRRTEGDAEAEGD